MRSMSVKERNRLIKKVLVEEFGFKNVKVRGDRGTAYGWVEVTITAQKPHKGDCEPPYTIGGICKACDSKYWEIRKRVWRILEENDLIKELGIYYDDFNEKRYEILIDVRLEENVKTPEKREKEVIENNGYTVEYEGSWTWVKFPSKPSEEIRAKLKSMGFRFSRKRVAWYLPRKTEVVI